MSGLTTDVLPAVEGDRDELRDMVNTARWLQSLRMCPLRSRYMYRGQSTDDAIVSALPLPIRVIP